MKRRTFLTITGIGSLVAVLGMAGFMTGNSVEKILLNELNFLKLDDRGVQRFISDYTKSMTFKSKLMLKGYSFFGLSASRSQKINTLVNTYLLSTDFFINGMNESKTVRYVGLYDPYLRPCAHPFSSAQFPTTS